MAVAKVNGYGAPYRASTFQQQAGAQTQRSGVLAMAGVVSQSGGNITVPAFSFIQLGLLVARDIATVLEAPAMAAPFTLLVSAATPGQTDDLQFNFAKTPRDFAGLDVPVAVYDGTEWRLPPFVSIDGVLRDGDKGRLDLHQVGPAFGLQTTVSGSNYQNSPGALIDALGQRQAFAANALFPAPLADPDFARVDRVLYRRPADSPARVGVREFVLGGTYASSPAGAHGLTGFFDGSTPRVRVRHVIGSDNAVHAFAASGYGSAFSLGYKKLASDRATVLVAATSLFSMTDPAFAVAIDQSNNLHVVYVKNSQIFYRKFDPVGTVLVGETRVDAQATPSTAPAVSIDPANTAVFIAYQSLLGPSNNQIFFTSRSLVGALVTAPVNVAANLANLQNPDLCVTGDLFVHLVWEDTTAARIYYQVLSDIGTSLQAAASVSGATSRVGFGTLTDLAKSARVRVADNRSVFVTFLQDKGGGVFGLSVWNDGTAFMQTLLTSGESFTDYAVALDAVFNGVHLVLARSSSVDYAKLEGETVVFTLNLAGTGAASVSTRRDALGSMYHLWSEPASGGFTSYVSNVQVQDIGPAVLTGTLNNVTLTSSQFTVLDSDFGAEAPATGDQVVISAADHPGNDGTYVVTTVLQVSQNTTNDRYVVTVTPAFAGGTENPSSFTKSAFAHPTGNQADAVKTTSELQPLAYRLPALPTDVLLTRIGMPGQNLLNYLIAGQPALNANTVLAHGDTVNIDWGKTTAGDLTVSGGLHFLDMINNVDYTLADGSYPMADDTALYATLQPGNTAPTPVVIPVPNVPWSNPVVLLGIVKDGKFNPAPALSAAGVGQLDAGEADIIGEDLPLTLRARAGFASETSYVAYPSTLVVGVNDDYPTAIGKLDAQVGALENNQPKEQIFAGGTTSYTATAVGLNWSTNNALADIVVSVDGRLQDLDPTGVSGFRKLTTTTFQLAATPSALSTVKVRKEGTAYGGPTPPTAGKLWSDAVDHDILPPDGAFDVGGTGNRFAAGYFEQAVVNQLSVPTALGNVSLIRTKVNGDLATLVPGKPASLGPDGKVYTAAANTVNGQRSCGIIMQSIAPSASGSILLFGFVVPGILTGLGFSPGDEVFISETGTYTNGSSGLGMTNDTITRIGYADCADGAPSSTATDLILIPQTVAEAP